MDWNLILTAFGTLFLAELGDKTQLATLGLAARTGKPLPVFLGGAPALGLISIQARLLGEAATRVVPIAYLRRGAAGAFTLGGNWRCSNRKALAKPKPGLTRSWWQPKMRNQERFLRRRFTH